MLLSPAARHHCTGLSSVTYYYDIEMSLVNLMKSNGANVSYNGEEGFSVYPEKREGYTCETIYTHWVTGVDGPPLFEIVVGESTKGKTAPVYDVFGERVITSDFSCCENDLGYYFVNNSNGNCTLKEVYQENSLLNDDLFFKLDFGRIIGDADNDGQVSIVDATRIQLHIAQKMRLLQNDEIVGTCLTKGVELSYYSDMDKDGERTIMDATAIQKYLVNDTHEIVFGSNYCYNSDLFDETQIYLVRLRAEMMEKLTELYGKPIPAKERD